MLLTGFYQNSNNTKKSQGYVNLITHAAAGSDRHLLNKFWHTAVAGIADVYFTVCKI